MRRANIGAGSIQPEGWDNFDQRWFEEYDNPPWVQWDVRQKLYSHDYLVSPAEMPKHSPVVDEYDYAVCSFMLQELDHHEIPGALENMMAILKPGGTLRILVPSVLRAFDAFVKGRTEWFPQDERTGNLDAKFCSYVTWFGTVRSVFTPNYLMTMCQPFGRLSLCPFESTYTSDRGIVELDSRPREALIVEITKR